MTGKKWMTLILMPAALGAGAGRCAAAEAAPQRRFEVTTVTGMPHLDENLRYATVTETMCLNVQELSGVFWMLKDVSLQDCKLVKSEQTADAASYALQCTGGHGTQGSASWELGSSALTGTLQVRLGGKNMTFFQRVNARAVGSC